MKITTVEAGSEERGRGGLALHQRFALAGSAVMLLGMAVIGSWVSNEIEIGVARNSAVSSALYMESYIAPLSQELSSSDALSAATEARLRRIFSEPPLSERIVSVKIWKQGGLIAYASDADQIGKRFEPADDLRAAWRGRLSASFDDLHDDENAGERRAGMPLLEVYNPIHSIVTGEIIAVAEFYQDASELERDLFDARLKSWLIVGGVTLATFALLFGIVRGGSRTIERQHGELSRRFAELSRISRQNDELRRRIQGASIRSAELNEDYLRRISAELHDGPAQALALASLRLDSLLRRPESGAKDGEGAVIRASLSDALRDIRDICRGLTLPEIEGLTVAEALEMAVEAHRRRTGAEVALDDGGVALRPDHSTLICIYRFVQEGLMNAFRHAQGAGQSVSCAVVDGELQLSVRDAGPGFPAGGPRPGLGLRGLRERVESLGGMFAAGAAPGGGAELQMRVALGGGAV